ncbi:MAG: nitroreductase family protein [Anaerolineaceae bacterium]
MPTKIEIDPNICIQCESCVRICPSDVYKSDEGKPPQVAQPQRCIACGHCVAACPVDAIQHNRFPDSSLFPIGDMPQPDSQQILRIMQTRRSVREFVKEPVRKEQIQLILKAARSAPNASNFPTTHYTVVQDPEKLGQITELTLFYFANQLALLKNRFLTAVLKIIKPDLVEIGKTYKPVFDEKLEEFKQGGDPILHHAPVLLLFHGAEGRSFALENAQLAAQNAALMCHTLGLGCFYTGFVVITGRSDPSIARLVEIPKRNKIFVGLAIGVPAIPYQKGIRHDDPPVMWV